MSAGYNESQLAQTLLSALTSSDPSLQKQAADISAEYVHDRQRELSFADKLIPPDTLTPTSPEITRTTYNDQLTALVEVETTSVGYMRLNLRASPTAQSAKGKRVTVGFETLSTPVLEFDERSLLAYRMSLTKMYEDAAIKALHEAKDRTLLVHMRAAVETMQDFANAGAVAHTAAAEAAGTVIVCSKFKGVNALANASENDFRPRQLNRRDFIRARQIFLDTVLRRGTTKQARVGGLFANLVLLNEMDHLELSGVQIDETGSQLQGQIFKDGYNDNTLAGMRYIRTIKSHLLRQGIVYFITEKKYLGRSFQWMDMKFWLEKKPNYVTWMCWLDIGMAIINIASVIVLELFTASTTPGAENTGYQARIPVEDTWVAGVNNKVLEGLITPSVSMI